MDRNARTEIDAVRPRWAWRRAISTVSIISFLVAASACDATAVPPRSLEPLEPLGSEIVESAPSSSGRGSGTSATGSESSEWLDPSRVASMAPDVSAALVVASAELIEHCVDLVQVGAFLGDTELVTWWDDVERDEVALRHTCREVAVNDPWHLEQLSEEWRQMEALLLALTEYNGESASDADVTGP
jgi:hypothetical protein